MSSEVEISETRARKSTCYRMGELVRGSARRRRGDRQQLDQRVCQHLFKLPRSKVGVWSKRKTAHKASESEMIIKREPEGQYRSATERCREEQSAKEGMLGNSSPNEWTETGLERFGKKEPIFSPHWLSK